MDSGERRASTPQLTELPTVAGRASQQTVAVWGTPRCTFRGVRPALGIVAAGLQILQGPSCQAHTGACP
eukprot:scaffold1775_cov310-Prasinococcus_capsulatus_cf.AAC.1